MYPDNSDMSIYGSNTRIDNRVYRDYTLCTNFHRAYSRNCALSFALTVEVYAIVFDALIPYSPSEICTGAILVVLVLGAFDF